MKNILVILFILSFFLGGCIGYKNTTDETPTRGKIKISVDESYQMLADAQIATFTSLYSYTTITPAYKNEVDAIADLMNDSVRLVIINRKLTPAEEAYLTAKQVIPKTTKIAYDGLAFIVNRENQDTLIRYDQLKNIFNGTIKFWNQLNLKSTKLSEIKVVFDNNKSGNTRYVKENFINGKDFPPNCFAVNSNTEVINFVEKNRNAMGIIGVNWISDKDDTLSNSFLKKINIVAIGTPDNTEGPGNYYKPYQGYIAEGTYPLKREVFIVSRETFSGLGSGFTNFVAGDKGQRIILKMGLVPATMPIRIVEIKRR